MFSFWCFLSVLVSVESFHLDKLIWQDKTTDGIVDVHSDLSGKKICFVERRELAAKAQVLVGKLNTMKNLLMASPDGSPFDGVVAELDAASIKHEEKKKVDHTITDAIYDDKLKSLYFLMSFLSSVGQFVAEGFLADAGEEASTSQATALVTSKECRDLFTTALTTALNAGALTEPNMLQLSKCIAKDMNKCVVVMRRLQWAATGIENAQSILDTMYELREIELLEEATMKVGSEVDKEKQKEAADRETHFKKHMEMEQTTEALAIQTQQEVADLEATLTNMITTLGATMGPTPTG
jgi:hypothetical protein